MSDYEFMADTILRYIKKYNNKGKFGKHLLVDFISDPNYINVNHGSYGIVPKSVLSYQKELQSIA